MKKRLLQAFACALLAAVIALPGALALEKANTQKELTYGGIEWYIDYGALADTLAGTALDSDSVDREDNFGSGSFYAPDWISVTVSGIFSVSSVGQSSWPVSMTLNRAGQISEVILP